MRFLTTEVQKCSRLLKVKIYDIALERNVRMEYGVHRQAVRSRPISYAAGYNCTGCFANFTVAATFSKARGVHARHQHKSPRFLGKQRIQVQICDICVCVEIGPASPSRVCQRKHNHQGRVKSLCVLVAVVVYASFSQALGWFVCVCLHFPSQMRSPHPPLPAKRLCVAHLSVCVAVRSGGPPNKNERSGRVKNNRGDHVPAGPRVQGAAA